MNRPQVNLIEDQKVEITDANIDSWEAEQLLRKYGYKPEEYTNIPTDNNIESNQNGLTFEEMIALEDRRIKEEEDRRRMIANGPKPITFDAKSGYSSEVKYSSDDESGFGFKIEITTDMIIPKY